MFVCIFLWVEFHGYWIGFHQKTQYYIVMQIKCFLLFSVYFTTQIHIYLLIKPTKSETTYILYPYQHSRTSYQAQLPKLSCIIPLQIKTWQCQCTIHIVKDNTIISAAHVKVSLTNVFIIKHNHNPVHKYEFCQNYSCLDTRKKLPFFFIP